MTYDLLSCIGSVSAAWSSSPYLSHLNLQLLHIYSHLYTVWKYGIVPLCCVLIPSCFSCNYSSCNSFYQTIRRIA